MHVRWVTHFLHWHPYIWWLVHAGLCVFVFLQVSVCSVRLDPNDCWLLDSYFWCCFWMFDGWTWTLACYVYFFDKSIFSMIKSVLSVCSTQKDAETRQFIYYKFSDWILHDLTIFDQFHPNSLHLNLGVAGGTGGLGIAQHQAAPFVAPSRSPGPSTRLRAHDQLRRLSGAWPGTGPKKLRLVGMLIHAEICAVTIYLLYYIYIGIMYILL